MMFKREQVFIALALGHIALVAMGMTKISLLPASTIPGQVSRIYCGLSGADNTYAFFAPGVRHQERATFIMTDEKGREWGDDLEYGETHEANLRLGSTSNVLRAVDDETAFHFMRSMTATMFKRHPAAKKITVQVQAYGIKLPAENGMVPIVDFPTMAEYRSGMKPEWIDLYSLTFKTDSAGNPVVDEDHQQQVSQ